MGGKASGQERNEPHLQAAPASRFPAVTAQGQEAGVRVRLVAVMEDERPPGGPAVGPKGAAVPCRRSSGLFLAAVF